MSKTKGPWGIYDLKDKCWIGNAKGPNVYHDHKLGRCALTVWVEMAKAPGWRYRLMPLPKGAWVEKDTMVTAIDGAEAIKRIERRAK